MADERRALTLGDIAKVVLPTLVSIVIAVGAYLYHRSDGRLDALEGKTDGMVVNLAELTVSFSDYVSSGERYTDDHDVFKADIDRLSREIADVRERLAQKREQISNCVSRLDSLAAGSAGRSITADDIKLLKTECLATRAFAQENRERIHDLERCCDKVTK